MTNARFDKTAILDGTLGILREITSDWDTGFSGPLGPDTRLAADLGCTSLDCVQLVIALEEHFQSRNLPFQNLFVKEDGRYVEDLRVSQLVDFLFDHVSSESHVTTLFGD